MKKEVVIIENLSIVLRHMDWKLVKVGQKVVLFNKGKAVVKQIIETNWDQKLVKVDNDEIMYSYSELYAIYAQSKIINPKQWRFFLDKVPNIAPLLSKRECVLYGYLVGYDDGDIVNLRLPITEALIYFCGDSSVGIGDYSFTMQIPDFTAGFNGTEEDLEIIKENRNSIRKDIKGLYENMSGDGSCTVTFDDELYLLQMEEDEMIDNFYRNSENNK